MNDISKPLSESFMSPWLTISVTDCDYSRKIVSVVSAQVFAPRSASPSITMLLTIFDSHNH